MGETEKSELTASEEELNKVVRNILASRSKDGNKETAEELTDDVARGIGNFNTAEALRKAIQENIKQEKLLARKERIRTRIADELVKKTPLDIAPLLVEEEFEKEWEEHKKRAEGAKQSMDEYVNQFKLKSTDELQKQIRVNIEQKWKLVM